MKANLLILLLFITTPIGLQDALIVDYNEIMIAGEPQIITIQINFNATSVDISFMKGSLGTGYFNMSTNINVNIEIPTFWKGNYNMNFTFFDEEVEVFNKVYQFNVLQKKIKSRGIGNYQILWDGATGTLSEIFANINYSYVYYYNLTTGIYQYYSNATAKNNFDLIYFNHTYIYYEL